MGECGERCTVLVINQLNNHNLHIHQVPPTPSQMMDFKQWTYAHVLTNRLSKMLQSQTSQFSLFRKAEKYWYHLAHRGAYYYLKGYSNPKMKILSSFTHPQVVANLYEFLFSAEHKGRYFEEQIGTLAHLTYST